MATLSLFLILGCLRLESVVATAVATMAQIESEVGEEAVTVDEEEPRPRKVTYLEWIYRSLGIRYSVLIPSTSLLVFVGAVMIVRVARHPAPLAAYMLFVAVPMLIGLVAAFDGLILSFTALSDPRPQDYWEGASMALVAPLISILLSAPSYLLVASSLLVQSMRLAPPKT